MTKSVYRRFKSGPCGHCRRTFDYTDSAPLRHNGAVHCSAECVTAAKVAERLNPAPKAEDWMWNYRDWPTSIFGTEGA